MATEVERLVVRLEATQAKFEKQLANANKSANRRAGNIERRFARMSKNIQASTGSAFRGLLGPLAAAGLARSFQTFSDEFTKIENALKVAGLEGEELTGVFEKLNQSARSNAAPIGALAELYSRAALAQSELGVSSQELITFADNVAVALRVSGKSATESRGALIQLSQAMGAGVVRAEEFNAILEGALPIAQAAAHGLKEAGGSVAKLRQLVIDGKVSSEAFFRAFEAGASTLQEQVADATFTTSQQFTRLSNSLVAAAGKMDDATGFSNVLASALGGLAGAADLVGDAFARASNGIDAFKGAGVDKLREEVERLESQVKFAKEVEGAFIGNLIGTSGPGVTRELQEQLKKARELLRDAEGDEQKSRIDGAFLVTNNEALKKPVSLEDFRKPTSKGGRKKKSPAEKFSTSVTRLQQETAAIIAQTAAYSSLNPLINDYGFKVEQAAARQRLLQGAQNAGLEITPQLREQINQLATSYATAASESEQLAERQANVVASREAIANLGQDVLGGFINDLRQGKSASDAFAGALNKVLDQIIQIGIQKIVFGAFGLPGLSDGGPVGFSGGGFTGVGGKYQPAGIVHKGEYVIPAKRVRQIGLRNLEALHRGYANGGVVDGPALPVRPIPQNINMPSRDAVPVDLGIRVGIASDSLGNIAPFVESVADRRAGHLIQRYQKTDGKRFDANSARSRDRNTHG